MSTKCWLRIFGIALVAALALGVTACGRSNHADPPRTATARSTADPSSSAVVVRVGAVPITQATYKHWMAIGAATVEMPKPTGPLPKVLTYTPPTFTACASQLQASSPHATIAQLKARCKSAYEGIRARVLTFLITGSWLRQQAAAAHVAVTPGDIERRLAEERKREGPAMYRRLIAASHQTAADFDFAIETRVLSERLEERFVAQHKSWPEQRQITGFNRSITSRWIPATYCEVGYVVKDCRDYKA